MVREQEVELTADEQAHILLYLAVMSAAASGHAGAGPADP
jgi:hypothetical protein